MIGWRTLCASKAAVFGVYSEITWLLALGQIYVYPELKKKKPYSVHQSISGSCIF